MFKTLVVPLDGTPQSNVALPLARLLARASRGRLVLVRVVDPAMLGPDERVEHQRVMVGSPADRIVASAEQVDADLIVMSTHGYQAPLSTLLGSTANEVVRAAGRPVLLVRRTDVIGGRVDSTVRPARSTNHS
jgi:nucleotide-binding universal stress UspA family protein